MRNQEISRILQEANNKNSYLWDLPRPQWKDIDFENLNKIKEGKHYINSIKVIDYVNISDYSLNRQEVKQEIEKI
jgi:hypothetical protein